MKNLKTFSTLIILTSTLLMSCNSAGGIILLKNADNLYASQAANYEVSSEHLVKMLETKSTFVLYMYSPYCATCVDVSNYFSEYSIKNPGQIIKINMTENYQSYSLLSSYDESIFPKDKIITPRVLFIKEGKLDTEMNPSKFDNYNLFKGTINSFSHTKTGYIFTQIESYNSLLSLNNDYLFFSYNSKNKDSSTIYNEKIYPLIRENTKLNYYICDTSFLQQEVISYISKDLNIDSIENIYFTNKNQVSNYLTSPELFTTFVNNI